MRHNLNTVERPIDEAPPGQQHTLVNDERKAETATTPSNMLDFHLAIMQGMARSGVLFLSLVLGAMLGSLIAGQVGATIGCVAAPLLLVLLWWPRRCG
jgi:hypothetical protein